MKRAVMLLAAGALIFGSALSAMAQAPTVSFGGQMRVYGYSFNNITDFKDTAADGKGGQVNKDSSSAYYQRFRLATTIESADKKAKAVWQLEIGDIVWGNGGGASGGEYNVTSASAGALVSGGTRVGPSQGGGLGGDGVNVETKHLYLWFEIPGLPGASLLAGLHNIVFLTTPVGGLFDDDGAGLQFNWKSDPIDLQLYVVKISENSVANADDNDMYVARLGVNVTKDTRVTGEIMVLNTQCLARRTIVTPGAPTVVPGAAVGAPVTTGPPGPSTTTAGTCVSADFGDNFWIGLTAGTKVGDIKLNGVIVYGQRELFCPTCGAKATAEESGFGILGVAQIPVGPLSVWAQGWYMTGDKQAARAISPGGQGTGSTAANGPLTGKSDKLPLPISGAGYFAGPFIAEGLLGYISLGGPGFSGATSPQYADPTGTYGVGGSALYAVTPQVTVGGGVALVGASETNPLNLYGDNLFELDAGAFYQYNANLSIRSIVSYLVPDQGDNAFGLVVRAMYSF